MKLKLNKWTEGLAVLGVVSLASAARADQQMNLVQTALPQTTLSGYVDTAMQWNPGTDKGSGIGYPGNVPKYSFAQDDGFTLNAVDIALDKPEDTSPWAAGYHAELMYGSDAVGVPIGTSQPTLGAGPSATVRQAFIRLHTPLIGNGIDWQVGVFDSIIGYESNSGPLNPNYTRSYGYTIEPTTFTGVLGTYKVNDAISVSAGVANEAFVNSFTPANTFESQKCYMGSISLTAPDSMGFLKGATLSGGVVRNVNANPSIAAGVLTSPAFPGATTSWYAGVTLPTPITQLKVGASFDYLMEDTANDALAFGIFPVSTDTTGSDLWDVAGYATYQATDKLSFNLRGEYFNDNNAFDNASFSGFVETTSKSDIVLYPANNAEEVTATVQYNLWTNVMTRGEFRWDHVEHGNAFGFNSAGNTFRSNDFLLALNVVFQF